MLEKPRNFVLGKRRSFIQKSVHFVIVPRLQQWAIMAGPHTENGANHLGLPSDCANGPSNLGPSGSQNGAIHRASPVSGREGPNEIRPECWLLEAPMDRMRSYPLFEFKFEKASRRSKDKIRSYPPLRAIRIRFE